jgi:putative zinc-binding metallo-peptidase
MSRLRVKTWTRHAIALIAVLAIAIGACVWLLADTPASRPTSGAHTVRDDFGFPFIVYDPPASTWKEVTFRSLSGGEIPRSKPYADLVAREMRLYSSEYLRSSGLSRIALVRELTNDGRVVAAVPDYPTGVLYLDPTVGDWDSVYQRHVIHHEFFHFVEGKWEHDAYCHDPEWIKLNDASTRYGRGGKYARDGNVYELSHPARGFINLYAESAVEEDMAEMFAAMRVPEERQRVQAFAKDDPVLRAKIDYIEAFFKKHGGSAENSPRPKASTTSTN